VTDSVQVASEADVDRAVAAAKAAFPGWSSTPGAKRAAIMLKFADLLDANAERIGRLESICMGQPITLAKGFVSGPAATWRYYAGYAGKISGESYPPEGDGSYKIVAYEPLGVCAGIAAWNGTHALAAWKMAAALAAGNTFVFKPSEKSPLGACLYGELIKEAGFPPGVINVVIGAASVGAILASHMEIAKIAFTGSAAGGRAVTIAAAKSNMKHVSLELGGKSPGIIFDDANLENALLHNSTGFLRNSGQVCFASSRVFVQEGIAPKFIEGIKKAFEDATKKMGDPSLAETAFGPLADKKQFERVMGFLNDGKAEGVEVLTGGGRLGDKGTFVQPTVLLNPDVKSKVYTDEIFGPVISVKTFKTEEEVIALANDTTYGLGCEFGSSPFNCLRHLLTWGQPRSSRLTLPEPSAWRPRLKQVTWASIRRTRFRHRRHLVDTNSQGMGEKADRKVSRVICKPRPSPSIWRCRLRADDSGTKRAGSWLVVAGIRWPRLS
jgi:aldehyde dehydrogenase (NAD+)